MKTTIVLTVSVLLLLFSACGPKVNDSADIQAIKALVQDFVKGYEARDADALSSLMSDDIAFSLNNIPAIKGKDAVQKLFKSVFEQLEPFEMEFSAQADDVQVSGDLAVARGTYARSLTHKSALIAASKDNGNWTAYYRREGGGSWKLVSDMGNSEQLLPGSTASGEDEKALLQIEQDLAVAFMKGDTAAMDKFLAREWAWTDNGQYQTKAQVFNDVKNNYKLTSLAMKEMNPHVFGNHAIVTMIGELKGTYKGKDVSGRGNSTDYFIKRGGRWQMVYTENTPLKP